MSHSLLVLGPQAHMEVINQLTGMAGSRNSPGVRECGTGIIWIIQKMGVQESLCRTRLRYFLRYFLFYFFC